MYQLDHLVVFVENLEEAVQHYKELGFNFIHKGGKHPFGTFNELIYLSDKSYIELVSYIGGIESLKKATEERISEHFQKPTLETRWISQDGKSGCVDFALTFDDSDKLTRMKRFLQNESDFFGLQNLYQVIEGSRERENIGKIRWKLAVPKTEVKTKHNFITKRLYYSCKLPFFIDDITERENRVDTNFALEHPYDNGVIGISKVELVVPKDEFDNYLEQQVFKVFDKEMIKYHDHEVCIIRLSNSIMEIHKADTSNHLHMKHFDRVGKLYWRPYQIVLTTNNKEAFEKYEPLFRSGTKTCHVPFVLVYKSGDLLEGSNP
ncbi:hypothetical protein ABK040_014416 [Willaertia magna]